MFCSETLDKITMKNSPISSSFLNWVHKSSQGITSLASLHWVWISWIASTLIIPGAIGDNSNNKWPDSQASHTIGHYPGSYCKVTNLMLIPGETNATFYSTNHIAVSDHCFLAAKVWSFGHQPNLEFSQCDEIFDKGHVFTFFYYYGQSNYFHLHYDTAIPLFKAVFRPPEGEKHIDVPVTRAFLPTVESRRLEYTNWETNAFSEKYAKKYWNDIINFVAKDHTLLPMDRTFLDAKKTICFKTAYFGTPSWKNDGPTLIMQFIAHVQRTFDVNGVLDSYHGSAGEKVGILHRAHRRKILNEDELVTALNKTVHTELVTFDGLTFKQQVKMMQNYHVFIAMNGAGLMNCLYLPPTSTCIQLVPYKAELNFGPYGDLLKARGPYLEWHNTHEENHVHHGTGSHADDTTVHVEELRNLVEEALNITRERIRISLHDEF